MADPNVTAGESAQLPRPSHVRRYAAVWVALLGFTVLTFALSLERMARTFAGIPRLAGGERVASAMRAHPELIGYPGATDTELMKRRPGWIAKGGAEGLLLRSAVLEPEQHGAIEGESLLEICLLQGEQTVFLGIERAPIALADRPAHGEQNHVLRRLLLLGG